MTGLDCRGEFVVVAQPIGLIDSKVIYINMNTEQMVYFVRGLESAYSPSEYVNALYFCTDTGRLILNGLYMGGDPSHIADKRNPHETTYQNIYGTVPIWNQDTTGEAGSVKGKLKAGNKTYDGSADKTITAGDLGALELENTDSSFPDTSPTYADTAEKATKDSEGNIISQTYAKKENLATSFTSQKITASQSIKRGDHEVLTENQISNWAKATSKPSYTPTEIGAAAKAHSHTKTDITDFPSSLPASDVQAWAKAASKPSYKYSEISQALGYEEIVESLPDTAPSYSDSAEKATKDSEGNIISQFYASKIELLKEIQDRVAVLESLKSNITSLNITATGSLRKGSEEVLTENQISDWARATSKPVYGYSEVSGSFGYETLNEGIPGTAPTYADTAEKATQDGDGNIISQTYTKKIDTTKIDQRVEKLEDLGGLKLEFVEII